MSKLGGSGTWARVIRDAGVPDVIGVDGNWVDFNALVIPPESFVRSDLSRPFTMPRRFDMCLSLETAEHLPEDRATGFVQDLTHLSERLAENNLSVCGYFSAVFSSQHLSLSGQYFGAGLCGHIV